MHSKDSNIFRLTGHTCSTRVRLQARRTISYAPLREGLQPDYHHVGLIAHGTEIVAYQDVMHINLAQGEDF